METQNVEFKQVVSRGCGIDVHEKILVATIDGEGLKKETREFLAFTSSIIQLRDWIIENGVTHVAMESTGVYWKPVYNILENCALTVWVVNARHIKYVPGHKTDKRDSKWICKLLLAGLLKPSYIPSKEQRELRDLTRYRRKLTQQISAQKNRIVRVLEDCNVKLSSVLSDTCGAVASKLINMLCEGKKVTMEEIDQVYHKKLKCSKEELWEACNGNITPHNVYFLQMIQNNIDVIQGDIAKLNARIKDILLPYEAPCALLKSIPGLDTRTIEDLIAEIGLDMDKFPTEKNLASWVGIAPGNYESAGKKKTGEQCMEINMLNQQ
jgi:transposase